MRVIEIAVRNSILKQRLAGLMTLVSLLLLASLPAQAETVTGTFRYQDSDGILRPIAHAKVEVWRFRPRTWTPFGWIWGWGTRPDATPATDGNGNLSVDMSFEGRGVVYGVRVFATNYAAVVWPNDAVHIFPFYNEPKWPDGSNLNLKAQSASDTLDFSYDFVDDWSTQHYNLAETVRLGFDYANARRDPQERDIEPIPQANVQPTSAAPTGTYYNYLVDTLVIESSQVFDDFTILHEYAHFLEEQISSFAPIPAIHYGCRTEDGTLGRLINSAEHAWMEGFAGYFTRAVERSLPKKTLHSPVTSGTPEVFTLETPDSCDVVGQSSWSDPLRPTTITSAMIEHFVAASLWDLFDANGDDGVKNELHDVISRRDREIFEIFDRELDVYERWPTIGDFRNAWNGRGLPPAGLDSILYHLGIETPSGNLYAIFRQGGSGTTEAHALNGADNFHSFLLQTPTALTQTGSDNGSKFLIGDHNRDGWLDLYHILRLGGSNTTEVHVLNGRDNFQTWLLQTPTALHQTGAGNEWEFDLGDFNRDGWLDLYAVSRLGGSGTTEVHVLNGAANFCSWLLHSTTALHQTGTGNEWVFRVGDYNRDSHPDLFVVLRTGGSNTTEVHVLDGKDNFRTWLLQTATALHPTGAGYEWDFLIEDYNRDGQLDLYSISRAGPSGKTEVHVLNGAAGFGSFLLQVATTLQQTGDDGAWRFAM